MKLKITTTQRELEIDWDTPEGEVPIIDWADLERIKAKVGGRSPRSIKYQSADGTWEEVEYER